MLCFLYLMSEMMSEGMSDVGNPAWSFPPAESPRIPAGLHLQDEPFEYDSIADCESPSPPFFISRKGVSFLSRIIGVKKKDQHSDAEDESSGPEPSRMSIDTSHPIGFIPRHPAPARYLRVRTHYKKDKQFERVFLAQELAGIPGQQRVVERRMSTSTSSQNGDHTGRAIWALEFSKDGKYLAAAGQDKKVRIWAVISTPDERESATQADVENPASEQDPPPLKAPVFHPKPVQVFEGHSGSILDLSWSKVSLANQVELRRDCPNF